MKYYNTELQQKGINNEQTIKEILEEIKKTTESSLKFLNA